MKITVLVEDQNPQDPRLRHEHGLSLFCETDGHAFLFDLGRTDAFLRNAETLGIDIARAEFAVVSHAHYDHGGGLPYFLTANRHAPVYLSAHAAREYYFKRPREYIGLDLHILEKYESRIRLLTEDAQPAPGVDIWVGLQKVYPMPAFCRLLLEKADGGSYPTK